MNAAVAAAYSFTEHLQLTACQLRRLLPARVHLISTPSCCSKEVWACQRESPDSHLSRCSPGLSVRTGAVLFTLLICCPLECVLFSKLYFCLIQTSNTGTVMFCELNEHNIKYPIHFLMQRKHIYIYKYKKSLIYHEKLYKLWLLTISYRHSYSNKLDSG